MIFKPTCIMESSLSNGNAACNDDDSLKNFTKTVLNSESVHESESSEDSAIMLSPEKDFWQSQSCSEDREEDQFEVIFYNTVTPACITKVKFISRAFFTGVFMIK